MTKHGKRSVGLWGTLRQRWQVWKGERSAKQRGGALVWAWLGFILLFVLSQAPLLFWQSGVWEIHVLVPSAGVESAKSAILQATQSRDLSVELVVSPDAGGDSDGRPDPECDTRVSRIGVRVFSSVWALPTELILDAPKMVGVRVCRTGFMSPGPMSRLPWSAAVWPWSLPSWPLFWC